VVAAVKALRMISIQEQNLKETTSDATVSYVQQLNGRKRNVVKLFPGCYSVGSVVKADLSEEQLAALNHLLPGAAVNVADSWSFNRIIYGEQIFYSQNHSMEKKLMGYGFIIYFLKVILANQEEQPYYLAAIKNLQLYKEEEILADITISTNNHELGGHLKPCKYDRHIPILFVHIHDLGQKQVAVDGLPSGVIYVINPPNTLEMD
ncbi:Hypothetical predicted protein, partial [Paramuricea clavata]